MALEKKGASKEALLSELDALRRDDVDWAGGRAFGYMYNAGDDVNELLHGVSERFLHSNALSLSAFPSLRHMETWVTDTVASLLNAPESAGSLTSGGTESILMAVKTARAWARKERPEITAPEMVIPISAHPAFEKAAYYLGVKAIRTPLADDLRADVGAMRAAMNERTVLLVGSAPGFPHGIVDPMEEIAALAVERGILCHVDGCLGGFMLPFVERLGHPVPLFDFRVPGVTSMSADLHKYGFASKGVSCVVYRSKALRRHQFFVYVDWPGGIYASPTAAGARGGGPIAGAWAVLRYLGEEGYLERARRAMEATRQIREGIAAIDGLSVLGNPAMTVLAFASPEQTLNVYALADAMERRGWVLDRLQLPAALHLTVSPAHLEVAAAFVADLGAASEEVRDQPPPSTGMAAVYGMLATVPERGMVEEAVLGFMDDWHIPEAAAQPAPAAT